MNVGAILKELSPRARIGLGAALAGTLLICFLLLSLATKPSYAVVMSGIEPGKSDKITEALAARGVGYELRDGGTSLAVDKGQVAQARIALANAGVNAGSGSQPGFELLDQQKLGSSDFQQRVTYQRALEGEIAKTVGQIDGVSGAQVQLTLPEDQLFSSESKPATAAVMLSGAAELDGGQVKGVASLVASSVSGLKTDNVTITDGSGQMLWPNGESSGSASAKAAAQARYAAGVESDVNDMLDRSLGVNKARVEVAAELNLDESSKEELAYAKKGVALDSNTDVEKLRGSGANGSTAGTAANITGATAAAGTSSDSNYDHKITKENFGVGKIVTKTKVAPGAVEGLQIALLVDDSVAQPSRTDLTDMVSQAAGLKTARGDTITFTQMKFATPTATKAGLPITPGGALDVLKYVLAAIAALVFLVLASRALRRREQADLTEPTWLREIESPQPLSELVASLEASAGEHQTTSGSSSRDQLAAVAAQDPERLARQLRQWMAESST